jgi:hypothetical protein
MCARWRSILNTLEYASIALILVLPLQMLPESTTVEADVHLNHCEDDPAIRSDVPTPTARIMAELIRMRDTTHQTASVVAKEPVGWGPVSLHMVSRKLESPCGKILAILTTLIVSSRAGRVLCPETVVVERRPRTTLQVTTADQSALMIEAAHTIIQATALRLAPKIYTEDQNTLARKQDIVNMIDTALLSQDSRLLEIRDIPKTRSMFVIQVPELDIRHDMRYPARDAKADQEVRVLPWPRFWG